jgi:hypothetical protein
LVLLVKNEGSIASNATHKKSEFKQNVVSRRWLFCSSRVYEIVRGKGKDSKIESRDGTNQRFKGPIRKAKDPLIPNLHVVVSAKKNLNILGYIVSLTGATDKDCGPDRVWHLTFSKDILRGEP